MDLDALLHAESTPFDQGWLETDDGHRVWFARAGRPDGIPALLLHGGPGSGSSPLQRRFFDPGRYHIIQFDQRGCGLSEPRGELRHNSTPHLIADIERLRARLGVERWLVAGGSWGASLALAYAGAHRAAVRGLLLRGVFLTSRADLAWFFGGAAAFFPAEWEAFVSHVPRRWRRAIPTWLERVMCGADTARAAAVTAAWWRWEQVLGGADAAAPPPPAAALADKYRVQARYLARRCHLGEARLLGVASRLHGVPGAILHGALDMVCPPANAWKLHRAWGGSRLRMVAGAGHNPFHAAMARAMRAALDGYAHDGTFDALGG